MSQCNFCHKTFPNKQSVRAHLRYCETYNQNSALGSLPKKNFANDQISNDSYLRPRRGQGLILLLDLENELKELEEILLEWIWFVRFTHGCSFTEHSVREQDLRTLFVELRKCQHLAEDLVATMTLDRECLYYLYRRFQTIQRRWLGYRLQDLRAYTNSLNLDEEQRQTEMEKGYQEGSFPEDRERLEELTRKIKTLLVST